MKWIGRLLAGLAVVLLAAVGVTYLYLDTIAKHAIEQQTTDALGVETSVSSVRLGLVSGRFSLSGLKTQNPEGFESPYFLSLGEGRLNVKLPELRKDLVQASELVFDDVEIYLEGQGRKTNYGAILANMKDEESSAEPEDEAGKKFVIQDVRVRNITAHVRYGVGPLDQLGGVDLVIPEIRLRDAGARSQGGVVVSQISAGVLKAVLDAVARQGGSAIRPDLLAGLGQLSRVPSDVVGTVTRDVTRAAADVAADTAQGIVGEAQKQIGDAAKGAIEGLGGLLGGKKKEE